MGFELIKKKIEKNKDPYEGKSLLIQHSYNVEDKKANTTFEFSKQAMLDLGMTPNTPSTYKVTYGQDSETGNLMLAIFDSEDSKFTSNITAKNTFSNKNFMDELVKKFLIDPIKETKFNLEILEEDGIFVASLKPLGNVTIIYDQPYSGFNDMLENVADSNDKTIYEEVEETETKELINGLF